MGLVFYSGLGRRLVVDGELYSDFKPYMLVDVKKNIEGVEYEDIGVMDVYVYNKGEYRHMEKRVFRAVVDKPGRVPELRKRFPAFSQSYIKYAYRSAIDLAVSRKSDLLTYRSSVEDLFSSSPSFEVFDIEVRGSDIFVGMSNGKEHWIQRFSTSGGMHVVDLPMFTSGSTYLVGYNVWGFDMALLGKLPFDYKPKLSKYAMVTANGLKPVIDLYVLASSRFSSSFGVGLRALQLVDVAYSVGLLKANEVMYKRVRERIATASDKEVQEYLTKDLEITHRLASAWVPLAEALGKLFNVNAMVVNQVAESASPGHLVEGLIHKHLLMNGAVVMDSYRNFKIPTAGGERKTRLRQAGVYGNVAEFDFSAMYPTTMVQYKLDPLTAYTCSNGYEVTYIEGSPVKAKVCFKEGPVYDVFKKLYEVRQFTKQLKKTGSDLPDKAAKIAVNSAYGITGKGGWGIISPLVFSFIFEFTDNIHSQMFNTKMLDKYLPIYGDTDSFFYVNVPEGELKNLEGDVNSFVKKYGELYEVKLEGYFQRMFIPIKKNYILINGGEPAEIKGAVFKPSNMPEAFRYRYDMYTHFGQDLRKYIADVIRQEETDALFVEHTMKLRELTFSQKGVAIRSTGVKRTRILAWLAGCVGAPLEVIGDSNGISINGARYNQDIIVQAKVIPISDSGEKKRYYLDCKGEYRYVEVSVKCSRLAADIVKCTVIPKSLRGVDAGELRQAIISYMLKLPSVEYLLKLHA